MLSSLRARTDGESERPPRRKEEELPLCRKSIEGPQRGALQGTSEFVRGDGTVLLEIQMQLAGQDDAIARLTVRRRSALPRRPWHSAVAKGEFSGFLDAAAEFSAGDGIEWRTIGRSRGDDLARNRG